MVDRADRLADLVRFHLVYRSSPGESMSKQRPTFYSKDLALASCLVASSVLPAGDRVFVCDGQLPEPRASQVAGAGEVLQLKGVGNARSYRACLGLVDTRTWDDEDVVYFAEDDYLYTPDAFVRLVDAVEALPEAMYFTLYDHPDYYRMRLHRIFMARHCSRRQVGRVSWRDVRSTTLTYGARVGALRADSWIHYLCSRASTPGDFAIFSIVEGAGGCILPRLLKASVRPDERSLVRKHLRRLLLRDLERHRLYALRPAAATHMETGMLAPNVDWAAVAASYGYAPEGSALGPR
jgi:hypothetical protein